MSTTAPARFVVAFDEINRTHAERVGGKGANLGELGRIDHVRIPAESRVTTEAFALIVEQAPAMHEWFERLDQLNVYDPESIADIGAHWPASPLMPTPCGRAPPPRICRRHLSPASMTAT